MPACLNLLPFELSKIIFDQVDSKDIKSLRLTCSSLRASTIHNFRLAFAHITTDLSPRSLRSLIILCENQDIGSSIERLTIVAAYHDPAWLKSASQSSDESYPPHEADKAAPCDTLLELRKRIADISEAAANQSDLTLLTTVLQEASNLRAITLDSGVYQGPEIRLPASQSGGAWHEVWKRALHVFSVTMTALAQSRLPLDELHIYGGYWGCGVPAYDIYRLMPNLITKGLGQVLVNLRILTLSYSTQLSDEGVLDTGSNNLPPSAAFAQRNYLGPASFLALCPNLEDLFISLYKLQLPESCSRKGVSADYRGESVFDHNAQAIQMPKLLRCKTSDEKIRQHTLLQVLKNNSQLETLDSRFVALVKACNWGPILDQCS